MNKCCQLMSMYVHRYKIDFIIACFILCIDRVYIDTISRMYIPVFYVILSASDMIDTMKLSTKTILISLNNTQFKILV